MLRNPLYQPTTVPSLHSGRATAERRDEGSGRAEAILRPHVNVGEMRVWRSLWAQDAGGNGREWEMAALMKMMMMTTQQKNVRGDEEEDDEKTG
tara:strand:+ start:340 stop:621 length:282 start_codon:yes stop_codon:yes gene_type:complete